MSCFCYQVHQSYSHGTFRYGPLQEVSLVGKVREEVGGYFPKIIKMLEESPFLKLVMPWGKMSSMQQMNSVTESDDGPIFWVRPGEQLIPTACLAQSTKKPKNELDRLRRSNESREYLFEDR